MAKKKIKYTDMCIWIDKHIYDSNGFDENRVFNYLYRLFYVLAYKKSFFKNKHDYTDYSLYAATQAYMRLVNPKQFLPDDDPNKLPKVKSVLNYIKKLLYPMKVNYQNIAFNEVINEDIHGEDLVSEVKETLSKKVVADSEALLHVDIEFYLRQIPRVIKKFLSTTIYANDKVILHKLYVSCLISLLKSITLSNLNKERLELRLKQNKSCPDDYINYLYEKERAECASTWDLDDIYKDIIDIYTIKIGKIIIADIKNLINDYRPSEDVLRDMMMSSCNIDLGDNNENQR